MTWEDLVKENPKLEGLESIFKVKKQTPKEKMNKMGFYGATGVSALTNMSFDEIKEQIESASSFDIACASYLFDRNKDLFGLFINLNNKPMVKFSTWQKLPSSTKRFIAARWPRENADKDNNSQVFFAVYAKDFSVFEFSENSYYWDAAWSRGDNDIPESVWNEATKKMSELGARFFEFKVSPDDPVVPKNLNVQRLKIPAGAKGVKIPSGTKASEIETDEEIEFPPDMTDISRLVTSKNLSIPENCAIGTYMVTSKNLKHIKLPKKVYSSVFIDVDEIESMDLPQGYTQNFTFMGRLSKDQPFPRDLNVEYLRFTAQGKSDGAFVLPAGINCRNLAIDGDIVRMPESLSLKQLEKIELRNFNHKVSKFPSFLRSKVLILVESSVPKIQMASLQVLTIEKNTDITEVEVPKIGNLTVQNPQKRVLFTAPELKSNTIIIDSLLSEDLLSLPDDTTAKKISIRKCKSFASMPKRAKVGTLVSTSSTFSLFPSTAEVGEFKPKSLEQKLAKVTSPAAPAPGDARRGKIVRRRGGEEVEIGEGARGIRGIRELVRLVLLGS